MAASSYDSTTLNSAGETTVRDRDLLDRLPTLTIVWHPDVARVGQSALVAADIDLSRNRPSFGHRAHGSSGSPLGDPYISAREPSFGIRLLPDRVELAPHGAHANVRINGARLTEPVLLSHQDLDSGVVITIARRVVLCLHLARSTRVTVRSDHGLVGTSDAIDDIRREIDQISDLDVPVLIEGESGTGKGKVAAAIVAASSRAGRPLLSINMGATVPSTAASDLFGHERGAFTGASAAKTGLFAAADGATLFMDEIGLTPADVRPMLLHVLETGDIRPLGSTRTRKVDVRFISATDTDLQKAIASGQFSEALYQRVARCHLTMPPLRDRREDFGPLLVHFLRLAFTSCGEPDHLGADQEPWLSASNVAALALYDWPGNVRELENVAGQIVMNSRGQTSASLPPSVDTLLSGGQHRSPPPVTRPSTSSQSQITDEDVANALAAGNGSASRAAKILGVSRTTYYELRKRNPNLRSIGAIPDSEILACREECSADVLKMAERLQVPVKALKDRLAQILRTPR
jgi:two-component system, NtrC family, nitrogen regulation response regulator GlnG